MGLRLAAVALLLAAACSGDVGAGPLRLDVPEGWRVTRSTRTTLQLADGTAGGPEATAAGTATAVFDVFLSDPQSPQDFERVLERFDARYRRREIEVGGREAVRFDYTDDAFGGAQIAVFVPDYRVRIVYRAAFKHDRDAFERGREGFLDALRSIRFVAPPSDPA